MDPVKAPEIGIEQLAEALDDGAAVVDVREPGRLEQRTERQT